MKPLFYVQVIVIMLLLQYGRLNAAPYKSAALKLVHVQGSVYTIEGGLGNVTVISDSNSIIVVDTKDDSAKTALFRLLKNEYPGKRLKYIVNTHMHFDHTGGNDLLCNGCDIIAHADARKLREAEKGASVSWPTITFDSAMTIYYGGEEIRLMHYAHSHTNHDVVVYFTKSRVLSMGDMYFSGMFPFIDTDGGGDLKGLIKSIGAIINGLPPDVKIVPGHGPVSSFSDLKDTHKMLAETSAFIQKKIDAGKSLDDIKKEGLPSEWATKWGNGFCKPDCWIEQVYSSLTGK